MPPEAASASVASAGAKRAWSGPRAAARFRLLLPLYLGLAAMTTACVLGLGEALTSPDFVVRMELLVLAGLAASLLGACTDRNPALLGALVAVLLPPALILSDAGSASTRFFFPDEALTDLDLLLPTLAVWLIAAFSFAQVNRSNAIFIFVCGYVVFGLTGTLNVNVSLLAEFFVYLLAAFFVWGYGTLLSLRERALAAGQALPATPGRWAHMQVGVGAAVVGVLFAFSVLAGSVAYQRIPSFYVGPFPLHRHLRGGTVTLRDFTGFDRMFTLTGGPIRLDNTPVFRVKAREPALWRGTVYDSYDTRGWSQTLSETAIMGPVRRNGLLGLTPRSQSVRPPGPTRELWQRVEPQAPVGSVLVGAATPVAFQPEDLRRRAVIDPYGCLRAVGGGTRGVSHAYTVVSARPALSVEKLARSPAKYPKAVSDTYLPVPALTRSKLQARADEVTAGCRTPYEKVLAIEQYVDQTCRYTLQVPPMPSNVDAVTYFLETTHRGACDLYASAVVVLLRLSGVPARLATGFATGQYDRQAGAYQVIAADAHAWAEVYLAGTGWVEFDPPSSPAPERDSWITRLLQPGWTGPTLQLLGRRAALAAVLLVLLNALFLAVSGASPLGLLARWARRRRTPPSARQRAGLAYERVCRAFARRGVTRQRWQTPAEFAESLVEARALPESLGSDGLAAFTAEFERLRYGAADPPAADLLRLEDRARALARRIRRARGRRQRRKTAVRSQESGDRRQKTE